MLIIGIDPAFRKNGFAAAIMDTEEKTVRFIIFKNGYNDFMSWILWERPDEAYFIVENSNLQSICWQKNAMAVGKNQAISQITVDVLRTFYGEKFVIELSPLEKGKKITNLSIFSKYTKGYVLSNYKGLVSEQDKRDAFKLAFLGINIINSKKIF